MHPSTPALRLSALMAALMAAGSSLYSQISYVSGTYTQDFNTLPTANVTGAINGTVGVQTGIPAPTVESTLAGWSATKFVSSTTTALAFNANDGASNSGALFSYGTISASDRALGALASGSNALAFGAEFVNNTGGTITSITISFTSEFWRSSTSVKNVLTFAYGTSGGDITSANYLTAAAMTAYTPLNVVGPDPVTSNGLLDGNLPANQAAVSATITGISVPAGTSIFIRWSDFNDVGNDAGLAIDDLSLSAVVSTGADISIGGGSTFTPTSFAGAAFTPDDTAVFNGSASTITLDGDVLATALKFPVGGYTLAGGGTDSIALTGAITVDTGSTATISGVLAGSDGVNKLGPGTLVLSGANTVEGAINILAGRLEVSADAALGAADNDLFLEGVFAPSGTSFTLGSGRTLTGSGEIAMASGSTLSIDGPVSSGALTLTGATTLNLNGATNSLGGLTLAEATTINVTGGSLQLTGGSLLFNQTSGTSTISGDFTNTGDRTLFVGGGTAQATGTVTLGGRIIKTGPGTLDLTTATVAGATLTSGGYQLGIQGASPVDGGVLRIASGAAFGNLAQFRLNSGTLEIVGNLTSATALSVGGRNGASVSEPTITGGDLTLTGTNGYFAATGAGDGDVLFNVNNTTTLSGNFNPTSFVSLAPIWVGVGGTGTLVIAGDASRLIDFFIATDSVTLVIDGTLGGQRLFVEAGATVSGAGVFSGSSPWEDADDNPNNNLTQPASPIYVASTADIFGTLAPSGVLTIRAATSLKSSSSVILEIDGATRGLDYDALAIEIPSGSGLGYALAQDGTLTLDFGAPAISGTYDLISTGVGVTRSGSFSSVFLTGSHTAPLTLTGSVWSGTADGASFSFDESTGVLTVTGGASPTTDLEDWRFANFGTTANTGTAADSADFDSDGVANLIEYATGSNPTVAGPAPLTLGQSGGFLTLTFNRIDDPTLTYTIMESDDLAAGFTPTGTSYSGTANDTVIYTDDVSLATPGVRRFLRMEVSY